MEMLVGTVLHWEALEPHSLHFSKLNLAGQSHKRFVSVVLCLTRLLSLFVVFDQDQDPSHLRLCSRPLFHFRHFVQKRLAFTIT
jgi:hypothetical protein